MCSNLKRCCCFNLKTGTLIIGIFDIAAGIMGMMLLVTSHNPDIAMGLVQKVGGILGILAGVFLVIGVLKGISRFILFWIIVKIIGLICLALIILTMLVGLISTIQENIDIELRAILITTEVVLLATFALYIFCMMVVKSYRKEMKRYVNNSSTA